ncbi:MAG: hypothetical protein AAGA15_10485 [Pseudomonadota bacterium]
MLDSSPTLLTYRASLHLADRAGTALLDEIDLLRSCFAAEMKRGWTDVHAACVIPPALYLVVSMAAEDDPVERMLRIAACFRKHAVADVEWLWPVVGPVYEDERERMVTQCHARPVEWGFCARPEEWRYSSLGKVSPQYAVASEHSAR